MNWKLDIHLIGVVLMIVSAFMLLPIGISYYYVEKEVYSILISMIITFLAGFLSFLLTKEDRTKELRHRDGFLVVTLSWLCVVCFGSLPYILSKTFVSFTNAFFESMAGFTTTGASVLTDIESVSKGILFWRSITQWIGGMGIVLFSLAILPMLGAGGMQLFKAEVPEITVDKLRPRIVDTAKALWYIYAGLTVFSALLYIFGGMTPFDALCHAFTTLATGGFSTKNASIAAFDSSYIELVTTIFMFLAGINYTLYFFILRGDFSKFGRSSEFKFYLTITIITILLLSYNIWRTEYSSILDSLRYASFQAISIMTGTGYTTANYEKWTYFAQILLFFLMFFGGMIGSTSGGVKQIRVMLMLKHSYREIYQLIHPRAVTTLKVNGKTLTKEVLGGTWGFLFLFLLIFVVGTLLVAFFDVDMITAASTVISAICNVGPALGSAGPAENYAGLPITVKWVLTLCMLIGRLEVYTVVVLFTPQFWRK